MNRRNFSKMMGITVTTPLIPIVAIRAAHADGAKMLDPESPQASALAFTMESDNPDTNCANCSLYSTSDDSDNGTCIIFPGSTVPANGLCEAYQPKK